MQAAAAELDADGSGGGDCEPEAETIDEDDDFDAEFDEDETLAPEELALLRNVWAFVRVAFQLFKTCVLGVLALQKEHKGTDALKTPAAVASLEALLEGASTLAVEVDNVSAESTYSGPSKPFFPRLILPNFSVLARACLWCLGARMWRVNLPSCVKSIPNSCLTPRIVFSSCRRPSSAQASGARRTRRPRPRACRPRCAPSPPPPPPAKSPESPEVKVQKVQKVQKVFVRLRLASPYRPRLPSSKFPSSLAAHTPK